MRSDTLNYVCVCVCVLLFRFAIYLLVCENVFVALWPLFYIFTVNFTHVNITDENLHRFKKRARYFVGEKINSAGQRAVGAYSTPQPTCFNYIAQHIALFLSIQHFMPMFVSFLTTMNMMRLLMAMAMSAPVRSLATLLSYCISCY